MKRLIVGYDGSAPSQEAARLAARIASRTGATVTVLHVQEKPGSLTAPVRRSRSPANGAARDGAELVRSLGAAATIRTVAGDPASVLAKASASADLVLVGHHGGGRLAELVIGSVAKRLASAVPNPVLIVCGDAPVGVHHVLAGTDGSACAQIAVDAAIDLAVACDARMTVVSAIDSATLVVSRRTATVAQLGVSAQAAARKALLNAAEACEARGIAVDAVEVLGRLPDALLDQAVSRDADVVAIGRSGTHGTSPDGFGAVADALLRRATGAVLVAG